VEERTVRFKEESIRMGETEYGRWGDKKGKKTGSS
jgi:hypothetical protein